MSAPVLIQTLYPASGRVTQILTGTNPVEFPIAIPGLRDDSDATHELGGDPASPPIGVPCNLVWAATWVIDRLTAGVVAIEFVRVKIRSKVTGGALNGTVRPMISGIARGAALLQNIGYSDNQFDFATDPQTGLAWSKQSVNAQTNWGFIFENMAGADQGAGVISKLSVAAWGTPGNPLIGAVDGSIRGEIESGSLTAGVTGSLIGTVDQEGL